MARPERPLRVRYRPLATEYTGGSYRRNLARCAAFPRRSLELLAQKPFVVPIPGTSHVRRLEENAAAAALSLSADTAEVLARVFAPGAAAGLRYPESHLARLGI